MLHKHLQVCSPESYKYKLGTNPRPLPPPPKKKQQRQNQSSLGLSSDTKTTGRPSSLKGTDSKIACKHNRRLWTRERHQVL